jgi:hypothetical protein
MTMLDDARSALRIGRRSEASRILSRIIQREPSNGEAWYLLAEAVDDFQQQTYCMGMATRFGYNPQQPTIVQPEPAPLIPPASTQPLLPPVMIVEPRRYHVEPFDVRPRAGESQGIMRRSIELISSLLGLVSSLLALIVVSIVLFFIVGMCMAMAQIGQSLPQ